MEDNTIFGIIQQTLAILEKEVGLAKSTLNVVASRSFKPISEFFKEKQEVYYSADLLIELAQRLQENLETGAISRNVYNLRTRGIRMLREVYETGNFVWKGPVSKSIPVLPESFEHIINGLADAVRMEMRSRDTLYIVRRFLLLLASFDINNISQIEPEHVQMFLSDVSQSRAKSMDDVVGALRKFNRYLTGSGLSGLPYAGLLMAPRARERKIYPCMPQDDLGLVIKSIDLSTAIGKRDYAILLLATSSGMRAGDIAKIKRSDIDWRKSEIHIVQGKTQAPVNLPLLRGVGTALADYILNSRPESKSPEIFLRSLAPFQGFKDGVSVACVLRRRMKAVGVSHTLGDGKTMHGIRRMLGTQMTIEGVPITTIAQILGHQSTHATKPYISLDIEAMLLYKESIGYSRKSYEYDLMRFCNYIVTKQLGVSDLKEEIVLSWCSRWESESRTSARRRIQSVRELLKYLSAIGIDCYVIPSSFLPRPETRTPYIFTDKELQSIFKECDDLLPNKCSPNRHLILPVLLRLIFFCGLRPNEGRELQSCDIDFDKGILHVRKNKSHKERYVAMSDDVLQMCKEFHTSNADIFTGNTYFFPSPNGLPYNRHWLSGQFRLIWHKARATNNEASAVVYDLRHRYATTMMMKWLDEGADLFAKLPYLSAFMGHTHFSDTAYYIHLLPEHLIRSLAIDWSHFSDLIPEVSEDE